jgi:hypothetical protein
MRHAGQVKTYEPWLSWLQTRTVRSPVVSSTSPQSVQLARIVVAIALNLPVAFTFSRDVGRGIIGLEAI